MCAVLNEQIFVNLQRKILKKKIESLDLHSTYMVETRLLIFETVFTRLGLNTKLNQPSVRDRYVYYDKIFHFNVCALILPNVPISSSNV